ncbi:TspO/MBR-related protein [Annulohypoxylon moriforme]|nr:TspO/MBR-related protein [Annulohypoxylon moriforme]
MTTSIPSLFSLPYNVFASPVASILLPIALGTSAGLSFGGKEAQITYRIIKLPPLSPPAKAFGPAWTVLYTLMGYASHRAVTMCSSPALANLMGSLYTIQLFLNMAWMPLFFGMRRVDISAADIVLLVGLNGYLTYLFFSVDSLAGWLLVPYMAWLGFGTYLTGGVGYLNNWDITKSKFAKKA